MYVRLNTIYEHLYTFMYIPLYTIQDLYRINIPLYTFYTYVYYYKANIFFKHIHLIHNIEKRNYIAALQSSHALIQTPSGAAKYAGLEFGTT